MQKKTHKIAKIARAGLRATCQHAKRLFWVALAFSVIWQQVLVLQPATAAIGTRSTATTANSGSSNVGSLAINKPSSVIVGDVLIAIIGVDNKDTGTGANAITAQAGSGTWTRIVHSNNGTSLSVDSFWHLVTASDGASFTFTWGGSTTRAAGGIMAYKGVDNTTPIDVSGTNNTGTGVTVTGTSVTTVTANAWVVGVFANDDVNGGSYTPPLSMTERIDTASAHGTSNDITVELADITQASAGSSGNKSATSAGLVTDPWAAHLFALRPAGGPTLSQSAYRWGMNADNTTPVSIADNISSGDDTISGTAIDTTTGTFYAVGDNGSNWIIERRRLADGSLCTSSNCTTTFGTNGRITEDVASSTTEKAYAVAIDPNDNAIYVVGMDQVTTNSQWRVEKRSMTTGNLVTSFNTTGVLQSNATTGTDEATVALVDPVNHYLYVGGYDSTGNNEWRIEKYRTTDGAYCTAANCGTSFGTNGVYTNNISSGDDQIKTMILDPTNSYVFVAGSSSNGGGGKKQWNLFKMHATNSNLCSAAECGTLFQGGSSTTAGIYSSDPNNTRDDQLLALQVDSAANSIYLGGFEATGNGTARWRLEKVSMDTATRDSTFNNAACNAGTGNAVCASFSSGMDEVSDMVIDGSGGYVYVFGSVDQLGTNSSMRIQKRQRSDGSLVSAWATSGTATLDPSTNNDLSTTLVLDVDRSILWAAGGDRSLGTSNMEWYFAQFGTDSGTTWLAAQDTAALSSTKITLRLRLLIHSSTQQFLTGSQNLKLQYAVRNGTCDTSFVGETYADVPTSGADEIQYHTNPSISDGTTAVAITGDPVHGSDTSTLESIEEANNFSPVVDIPTGQDGVWDFVLKDNLAFGVYCFRVADSTGTAITASVVPEISFCKEDPKAEAVMRHGTYFCGGIKKSFFWAN